MVQSDFYVSRSSGALRTAEDDVFAGCFEEVVHDLKGADRVAGTAADRAGVAARSSDGDAVKIREIRVDDADVGLATELDSFVGIVLGSAVEPHAVKDQIAGGASCLDRSQRVHDGSGRGAGDFQTDHAIVICAGSEEDWSASSESHHQLRHHISGRSAVESRTARQ